MGATVGEAEAASYLRRRKKDKIGFRANVCGMETKLGRTLSLKEEDLTALLSGALLTARVTAPNSTSVVRPAPDRLGR